MKTIHTFSAKMPSLEDFGKSLDNEDSSGLFFRALNEDEIRKFGLNPNGVMRKMSNGYRVSFVYEEKKISNKSVKQELIKRLAELETDGYVAKKADKQSIIEDIIVEKSKTADIERTSFFGYYHEKTERFIIDVAREELAQRAISTLVKLFGSLKLTTLYIDGVGNGLSENLSKNIELKSDLGFAGFEYADKLNLIHGDLGSAKFTGEYTLDHILDLINSGYLVDLVSLKRDGITFDFTSGFRIKGIKIHDDLKDDISDETDHLDGEALLVKTQELELELVSGIITSLVNFFDKTSK